MNDNFVPQTPPSWSSSVFQPGAKLATPSLGSPSLYRTSSNMSIKSNTTLNSFYNISSAFHSLKPYSTMLPYRVIEALSSDLSLKNVTARIADSGWAWLVSGRKLFVWRYLDDGAASVGSSTARSKASKCYELLLPPSDISHKAELVCILSQHSRNKFPSALAVSPEGAIRYWQNISQESNTIDAIAGTTELQGQECLTLVDIEPLGCILGTTTNSLVHISIDPGHLEQTHSPIVCRSLKAPQGILSGIGRKVSSLIFGSLPAANLSEAKHLVRIVRNNALDDQVVPLYFFVLSNCLIQMWMVEDFDSEIFTAEIDFERHIKEVFIDKLWSRSTTSHSQLTIWPIDVSLKRNNELLLFVMCTNTDTGGEKHFGFFIIDESIFEHQQQESSLATGTVFRSFKVVRNVAMPDSVVATPSGITPHHHRAFTILPGNADDEHACYIYNTGRMYRINLTEDEEDIVDEIDFQLSDDHLLAAVVCGTNPLLFSFKNGFVSLQTTIPETIAVKQSTAVDRQFVQANCGDKLSVIKHSLALYSKGQKARGETILRELFPFIGGGGQCSPIELDDAVCTVSAEICDQIPHSDPRWAQLTSDELEPNGANGNDSYVIIANQLEDKLITHRTFVELLQTSGAWQSMTSLTTSTTILPSKFILLEHTEKLIVSLQLRKLHAHFEKILNTAIKNVLEKRDSKHSNLLERSHLTYQDLFYQEVTKIDQVFWQLVALEEQQLNAERSNVEDNLGLVLSVTDIVTSVFSEVCLYRQTNGRMYESAMLTDCDYVLWSSIEHVAGVRDAWLKQFDLLIKCTRTTNAADANRNAIIAQKIVDLANIILDSYVCQLAYLTPASEKHSIVQREFQSNRCKCLMPLLHLKQFERAASLAEKYEDFEILIKICEELNNQEQLQKYVQQFSDKGFSEFLFDWYLKSGKQGKMLSTVSNNCRLTDFLSNHESLNWLHQIHLGQFDEASSTLKKLAALEEMNPTRKKTLLSIGKLSALATGAHNYADIDEQIKFLNYQSGLSETLLRKHGLDRKTLKVLSPEQLVDILTSGVEGPNEDEENFRKALEISEIIEKRYSLELYRQVVVKIWQRAFEKDDWLSYSNENYEAHIKKSFFYRLATSYFGDHQSRQLPQLETLTENYQLVGKSEKLFFFLRATYEMILHS